MILSPAKRMEIKQNSFEYSTPTLLNKTKDLIKILKTKNSSHFQKLMSISPKLADLNFQRYSDFDLNHTINNSSQSILSFKGDVYLGLQADTLNIEELQFANDHLRILSGLYGILRPNDLIQAYRLEMGTKLSNKKGKNLYDFWGNSITNSINESLSNHESKTLVNLASDEYYKVITPAKIKGDILKIVFKEFRDEKLKFITFNAKKARGLMAKYIIKNKLATKEDIKGFDYDNYYFNEEHSSENEYWFVR